MKVGDVVQLASGGPRMAVECICHDRVTCTWFEQRPDGTWSGEFHRVVFDAEALLPARETLQ